MLKICQSIFAVTVSFFFLLVIGCSQKQPLSVVLVSGSNEYFSDISLSRYKEYLERNYPETRITLVQAAGKLNEKNEYSQLPGLEALDHCDVALFFTRRLTIEGEQLEHVKRYVNSGRPIVALRTASHGFQTWLEFDKLVLGGNYNGHYPGDPERTRLDAKGNRYPEGQPKGPIQAVKINPAAKSHPILNGITDFESKYSLYKTSPVVPEVSILMTGSIQGQEPEPVVWTRIYKGARVCYIALAGLQDFENPTFTRLLTNAIFWAAQKHQQGRPN